MLRAILAIILLWVFVNAAVASSQPQQDNYVIQECPLIKYLHRKGLIWRGPDDWKSYDESFVIKIDHFVGAQWAGVNVGKIICVYKGARHGVFPVTIERQLLVPAPSGGKWGKDQGGFINCSSTLRKDCTFRVKVERPLEDLYKVLESFKK